MSIIWHKLWRDLAHNKLRTLLVVLSTATGVFALGLVFGLSDTLRTRMTDDHRATIPAHITFSGTAYDRDVAEAIAQEKGVAALEREIHTSFRWKLEGETDWRNGDLIARAAYETQTMNRIDLLDGDWPTERAERAKRALALERQSARYFQIPLGQTIVVEFGQRERHLPVKGIVRTAAVFPPQFGGDATFYTTPETVAWLTGLDTFNQLNVRLATFSQEIADDVAAQIASRMERMGLPKGGYVITDPEVHPLQDMVDTLAVILAVLGAFSLALSAFLIVNTMNAIVARQVWQIGVMKVIGATFLRVMRLYLVTALIYGALAVLVAVPLGVAGAHAMARSLLDLINIDSGPLQAVPHAIGLQVGIGLAVPLLAALAPVIGGARITPHQAISSYGLEGDFGASPLDRLIGKIRHLPRPLALSLRNTFRRKARVARTLLTLIIGGVAFIMVVSVNRSLNNTLETLFNELGIDVWAVFHRPHRVARLIETSHILPGITRAEVWDQWQATLSLPGGEDRPISLMGLPPGSPLFNPRILSGRRLLPTDNRAILLNSKIATDENIHVGDQIELTLRRRKSTWTVVGLILSVSENQQGCFVPFDTLTRELGHVDRGTIVMLLSEQHDAASQQTLIRALRQAYTSHGLKPAFFLSATQVREQNRTQFNLITTLMLVMAILAAIVGSLGLMGTLSINVVERRREIGVMRAIGATSAAIARIFVGEGILLGALSWLFAAPLSYPSARLFSQIVGSTLIQVPLDFSYSTQGMALWLAIVIVISILASLGPALRATTISVRQALAYE